MNATEFTQSCFEGNSILADEGDETVYSDSPDLVQRDIVSRFHLMRENFSRRNQTELVVRHPKTKAGFRSYCKYMGERFYKEHLECLMKS